MKTTTGKIYTCEYCGKIGLSKGGMTKHERACSKNPVNDTLCKNCVHCNRYEDQIMMHGKEGPYLQKTVDLSCNISHAKMYSPKVLRMNEEKKKQIISRCSFMMPTVLTGCSAYLKINSFF
ncbi:hypothetical protein DXA95_04630 [Odoribacter sp. OF09-27XD]|jgi:hypothetical protein|nr:hypothetical protein [Odoribacter sp. OF09-27XD]RHV96961.1 hypothetical protein DXA95_04630 [Odoribacter sp. OF09-27XD]